MTRTEQSDWREGNVTRTKDHNKSCLIRNDAILCKPFCYSSQSRRLKQGSGSLLEDLSKILGDLSKVPEGYQKHIHQVLLAKSLESSRLVLLRKPLIT